MSPTGRTEGQGLGSRTPATRARSPQKPQDAAPEPQGPHCRWSKVPAPRTCCCRARRPPPRTAAHDPPPSSRGPAPRPLTHVTKPVLLGPRGRLVPARPRRPRFSGQRLCRTAGGGRGRARPRGRGARGGGKCGGARGWSAAATAQAPALESRRREALRRSRSASGGGRRSRAARRGARRQVRVPAAGGPCRLLTRGRGAGNRAASSRGAGGPV